MAQSPRALGKCAEEVYTCIQLTVNDIINTRTDPGRLSTLWVQAGAFNR